MTSLTRVTPNFGIIYSRKFSRQRCGIFFIPCKFKSVNSLARKKFVSESVPILVEISQKVLTGEIEALDGQAVDGIGDRFNIEWVLKRKVDGQVVEVKRATRDID